VAVPAGEGAAFEVVQRPLAVAAGVSKYRINQLTGSAGRR
jgi:hypothetical protein